MVTDRGLWWTDNGAVLCTDHLGSCARYTGHDISGQAIEPVTAQQIATLARDGLNVQCETCRAIGGAR